MKRLIIQIFLISYERNMPPKRAQIWNIVLDAKPLEKKLFDIGTLDRVTLEMRKIFFQLNRV